MADIFLSYNEKDRDTVRRLAQALQQEGWSVWWDRRIPAGQTWRSVLEAELQSMRCMVVLWSANSVHSEWVCEEAAEARQLGRLVPVAIDKARPPAGFRELQAADLIGWDGSHTFAGLRQLVEDIERLIGKPKALADALEGGDTTPAPPPARPPAPPPAPLPRPTPTLWAAAVTIVLLAVAAAYAAWWPPTDKLVAAAQPASATTAAVAATATAALPVPNTNVITRKPKGTSVPPRCAALRERQSLGETISAEAQQFLRMECPS